MTQSATRAQSFFRLSAGFAVAVTVTVLTATSCRAASCSVSAAGGFDFGAYASKQATQVDGSGYISVTCTAGTSYLVGIDNGLHYVSPWRQLRSGGNGLNYQVYLDSSRTLTWGTTSGSTMQGTGTGAQQNIPVYGRIPAWQEAPDGSYAEPCR